MLAQAQRYRSIPGGLLAAVLVLTFAAGARAEPLVLVCSQASSEPGIPPEILKASLTVAVTQNTLTLVVANDTDDSPQSFYINRVYFNAAPNVTALSLVSPSVGWTLGFREDGFQVGGFGSFDAALEGGVGNSPYEVAPGQSVLFTMTLLGSGPFTEEDFTTELSKVKGGHIPSLAVAKFIRGSGNDASAFGNAASFSPVPEPATGALLCLGAWALLRRRRTLGGRP